MKDLKKLFLIWLLVLMTLTVTPAVTYAQCSENSTVCTSSQPVRGTQNYFYYHQDYIGYDRYYYDPYRFSLNYDMFRNTRLIDPYNSSLYYYGGSTFYPRTTSSMYFYYDAYGQLRMGYR